MRRLAAARAAASLAPGAAGRGEYFERADAIFVQTTGLLYQARYDEEWTNVAAPRELGHRPPEPVLAALRTRPPEPSR